MLLAMSNNNFGSSGMDDPFVSVLTQGMDQDCGSMTGDQASQGASNWSSMGHVADQENFSGSDRAFMWQQDNYMCSQDPRVTESGFISGSNTQPGSMTGHEEDLEGNLVWTNDGTSSAGGAGSVMSSVYDVDPLQFSGKFLNIFGIKRASLTLKC